MKLTLLRLLASIVVFTLFSITVVAEYNAPWRDLATPEVGTIWVQPGDTGIPHRDPDRSSGRRRGVRTGCAQKARARSVLPHHLLSYRVVVLR